MSALVKIRLVGAEFFHADRQTHRRTDGLTDKQTDIQEDMTKLIAAFRNLANVPENVTSACFRSSSTWEIFFCTLLVIESIVKERNIWACFRGLLQKKETIYFPD